MMGMQHSYKQDYKPRDLGKNCYCNCIIIRIKPACTSKNIIYKISYNKYYVKSNKYNHYSLQLMYTDLIIQFRLLNNNLIINLDVNHIL